MQIRIYNSLSRSLEPFSPVDPSCIRMYSCGPTVYNYAHIGNMRAFLFADLLQRVLRTVGKYSVRWVMNVTDIDDKTIRDSAPGAAAWPAELGEQVEDAKVNLRRFTEYYTDAFVRDIEALRIRRADFFAMPRATEYIAEMQALVQDIFAKGFAYVREGSVYFDVAKWRRADTYGKLFTIDEENFRSGVRIDADEYDRESVSDFALWKAEKPGEPAWPFTLDGQDCTGRPGWHLECSAMEKVLLDLPFDIHTGGIDLKFPHHEDEIAQSKCGYGIEPTNYWLHNEFLEVEGRKMSKSEGNFFTLRDLIDKGFDPVDIRWLMLSVQYSSRLNFTFDGVRSSRKARLRVQDLIYALLEVAGEGWQQAEPEPELLDSVFAHLADNLNTPKALAELFGFVNGIAPNNLSSHRAASVLSALECIDRVFDAWSFERKDVASSEAPAEVVALAEARHQARRAREWSKADELRAAIEAHGWSVRDTKEGFELTEVVQ